MQEAQARHAVFVWPLVPCAAACGVQCLSLFKRFPEHPGMPTHRQLWMMIFTCAISPAAAAAAVAAAMLVCAVAGLRRLRSIPARSSGAPVKAVYATTQMAQQFKQSPCETYCHGQGTLIGSVRRTFQDFPQVLRWTELWHFFNSTSWAG
jgi:hypothetical protein